MKIIKNKFHSYLHNYFLLAILSGFFLACPTLVELFNKDFSQQYQIFSIATYILGAILGFKALIELKNAGCCCGA